VVPVVDGKVSFFNNQGTVDLLADITGYFSK
ncbi:N-acetylmuramoyl-L-alanine amidase, partial [Streptomyces sp. SID7760]|nr:N-acetylmuramoyl-L-alanine amidase [Streptomyces sp. SID7760]